MAHRERREPPPAAAPRARRGAWARGAALAALALAALQGCGASHSGDDSGSRMGVGRNGRIEFEVEPTQPIVWGRNAFHVRLTWTDSGNPVKRVKLRVHSRMLSMAHGGSSHDGKEIEPGLYEVSDVPFSMGGLWNVQFRALDASLIDEAEFEFEVH